MTTGDILLHAEGYPRPLEVVGSPHRNEIMELVDIPSELRDRFESTMGCTPWPSAENGFTRMLTDLGIGTRYTAEIFRKGAVHREEFMVVRGPTHYDSASRFQSEPLGLTVRDLTCEVRRHFQLEKDAPGVIVSKVEPGGKSAVAGVRPFVAITHIDGTPLGFAEEFKERMKAEGERRLTLRFRERTWVVKIKVDPADK